MKLNAENQGVVEVNHNVRYGNFYQENILYVYKNELLIAISIQGSRIIVFV